MDHQKKLEFILKMTKHGLDAVQHFDEGGTALGGPSVVNNTQAKTKAGGIGGFIGNILGTNNDFQASAVPIQAGTNAGQLNQAYQGAQNALGQTGEFVNTVLPGVNQGVASQGFLGNQLMNQAQGKGPNPAQAALNEATGRNVSNQAALAASTRGAGANAGLIGLNAARIGADLQQQAAGQGATLQAQQQLAAQQQLGNLAAGQVGQGYGALGLQNQANLAEQGLLQGANAQHNATAVNQQNAINSTNAGISLGNQQTNLGVLKGIGDAINSAGKAAATGGAGGALGAGSGAGSAGAMFAAQGGKIPDPHLAGVANIYHAHHYAMGGYLDGGKVPGKPKVSHDSYSNDTVPAVLSPGEVVIDLNTLKDKGKLGKMARFVAQNIERKKAGRKL